MTAEETKIFKEGCTCWWSGIVGHRAFRLILELGLGSWPSGFGHNQALRRPRDR